MDNDSDILFLIADRKFFEPADSGRDTGCTPGLAKLFDCPSLQVKHIGTIKPARGFPFLDNLQ